MKDFLSSLTNNGVGASYDSFINNYKKKTNQTALPNKPVNSTVPNVPTNNVGATSTKPTPSPAKSAYVSSLVSNTPTVTQPSVQSISTASPSTINPNPAMPGQTTSAPQSSYSQAFESYIKSLQPSESEISATKNLSALQLQAQKDQEEALNRGETLGFASGEAARVNRNNAFGITAASNAVNALTGQRAAMTEAQKARLDYEKSIQGGNKPFEAGDNIYQQDPVTGEYKVIGSKSTGASAGFTLSPGENRYDAQGNLIASGGPKPMTQAQETAQIAKTEKEVAAQQSATQSIGLVNNLLSGDAYKSITGAVQNPLNIFGITNASQLNNYNQLQGLLKLGIRGLLKGQGAVSDYEGKILGQAASSLGRNLSNEDFKQALLKIRGVLQTNNGGTASVIIKDKNGKVLGQGDLTGQDIYDAVNDGNTIEYQ